MKHYYGIRSTNLLPKNDLGIKYFSSSFDDSFMKDQKQNTKNYKYKIIKIYSSRGDAVKLEIKLHSKFNVGVSRHFYNKAKQLSSGFDTTGVKLKFSDEHKAKIGKANTGRYYSKETREKIGAYSKTRVHTKETKMKISKNSGKPMLGKCHSKETRKKISDGNKNKPIIVCPHCGSKSISVGNMERWHFNNCRNKSLD